MRDRLFRIVAGFDQWLHEHDRHWFWVCALYDLTCGATWKEAWQRRPP